MPEANEVVSIEAKTAFLEAKALRKVLPSGGRDLVILDSVDVAVDGGEFVAIVGPSGSGKSTLLGLLAGLDRPTSGSVLIGGQAIENMSEDELAILRRHTVGFVFQSFQLLSNLTARENVQLPMELLGRRNPEQRADVLLEAVGLEKRGHHYPVQLSGGEQQRVAIARAFAGEPRLLFADEPTGNLDGATGRAVLELMNRLRGEQGTTLVLVTHDQQVAGMADRIIQLEDGRVVASEASGSKSEPLDGLTASVGPP